MKDNDYLREYINLFLLEKIKKKDEIVSSFQRQLQTTALKTNSEDEAATKQKVDEAVLKAVGLETDKKLELPEVRARIVDKAYEAINSVMRKNFNRIIANNLGGGSRRNIQEPFNPKLILSEIFMMEGAGPEKELKEEKGGEFDKDHLDSHLLAPSAGDTGSNNRFNVADFEKGLPTIQVKDLNCKKAFLFFDVLEKYDFKVDFKGDQAETYEGHILRLIYADEETLNYFVLRKSFFRFVRLFVEHFQIEYEARITTENIATASHLVLLASFAPALCKHLDRLGYVEELAGRIGKVAPAEHHVLLKTILNMLKNKSPMVQKLVGLHLFERVLELILATDSQANITLFSVLMSKASRDHLNTKQFISKELLGKLFERVVASFSAYDDLRTIAIKNKNKPSEFRPGEITDPVILIDLYCRDYYELIRQKLSIRQFRKIYYLALGFLRFVSRFNARLEDSQKVAYCAVITDLLAVFFYQTNIVDAALVSYRKLLCPETVEFLLEESFETNLISNCFNIFERLEFDAKTIATLSHFQGLLLGLIEACHMSGVQLKLRQLRKLLDRLYQIRQLIGAFYHRLKERYLAKGLLKYVSKLRKGLAREVLAPLDEILSQNALVLQKLSHTQILDENIFLYSSRSTTVAFERQTEADQIVHLVSNASQLLYIVSKVDRKDSYLEDVITYNLHVLNRIERFVANFENSSEHTEFNVAEQVIEFLIVHTYFVKTYDERAKKLTSAKSLAQSADLLVRIMSLSKRFVDLQSNHQIFTVVENIGLFWLLFFDFNYRFYDRMSFAFIDNLKSLNRAVPEGRHEAFPDEAVYRLFVCLNEFIDLKSKDALLNFVILRQLDTVVQTLDLSPTNSNFVATIFQKVFSSDYGPELHRFQQKYYLALSPKVLSSEGIRQPFLEFVCKNTLYLNKYVAALLRNLLDKNFEAEPVRKLPSEARALFAHSVLEAPLDPAPATTQFLLSLIQKNVRNKTLFEDLVLTLRRHLKNATVSPNAEIVRKLFLSESLFWKLVRLYRKDQLNLAKILKYLLLICRHFDFLGEITVPPAVVRALLNNREVNKFNDVYLLLLTYIFRTERYAEFQEDVERFFVKTKESLDHLLFFAKTVNLDSHLRTVYYSLKILRNCSTFVKRVPALSSLDADDFCVRYVLQILDDNARSDVVPVNNLFNAFRKRENVQPNFKPALFEAKIVGLVFSILRDNQTLFDSLLPDFFVANKLIAFAYISISSRTYKDFGPLVLKLLKRGLSEPDKDIFQDVYYDLCLMMNYDFGLADEQLVKMLKDHVLDKRKLAIPALRRLLDDFKRRPVKFDSMGFNSLIRALLKTYFLIENFTGELYLENYLEISAALDKLLESSYKELHSLTKLEKLVVNLYVRVYERSQLHSLESARVFLWLCNTHVEFKVSALVDKYIYMGLFNNFFKAPKVTEMLRFDQLSGEIVREKGKPVPADVEPKGALASTAGMTFEVSKVGEAVDQLSFKGLLFENELILEKFLHNLFKIDRKRFFEVPIKPEVIIDKSRAVVDGLSTFYTDSDSALLLLKFRVKFTTMMLRRETEIQGNESSCLAEWMRLPPAIETLVSNENFASKMKTETGISVVLLLIKLVRKLYKLVAVRNEVFMKPAVLQCLYTVWSSLSLMELDESGARNKLRIAVLRTTIRIMRNRYDEMRFVLYRNYLPSIFEYFQNCNPVLEDKLIREGTETPVAAEDSNRDNPSEKKEGEQASRNDQKDSGENVAGEHQQGAGEELPFVTGDPNAAQDQLYLSESIKSEALLELTYYLFFLVTRNQLLMTVDYKKQTFATIKERKNELLPTRFCHSIYEFLEREYSAAEDKPTTAEAKETPKEQKTIDDEIVHSKEFNGKEPPLSSKHISLHDNKADQSDQPKRPREDPLTVENASLKLKESSLSYKQKNILYVHKVLTTVFANIEKNGLLTPKEEDYLNFGLIALHKHLLQNLDPELFNAFGFFGLLASLTVDDRLPVAYKGSCLEILRLFLSTCREKNNVQPAETRVLIVFYERLLFDNFPEIVGRYFDVLQLVLKHVKFPQEFIDEYADKMSFCLFEAYNSVSEIVFVAALRVFVTMLRELSPKIDASRVGNAVYAFVKINNRDMKLLERTLFVLLLADLESRNGLDAVRMENARHFVRFSHAMEGYDKTPEALHALTELTESCDQFQKVLRSANFEAVYKASFKHFSDDLAVLTAATRLFLRYTYKTEDNKFEMFECLRLILRCIRRFHPREDPESRLLVLMLYKSLVNASLHKPNAEYLVKSDLSKVLRECAYHGDPEWAVVIVSLLFNIVYIFEREEFNIRKFVSQNVIELLGELFDEALESKHDATICELVDLFVGFVQHQFTDFFDKSTVRRVKLALNLYYNSLEITLKFLTVLRDVTQAGPDQTRALVLAEFDYVYLYHLHYRNLRNTRINQLAKHVIYNLLNFRGNSITESELITFGVPENIVHTFSLNDSEPVMILNLRIILFSLRFEKCLLFVRNNFTAVIREVLYAKSGQYKDEVTYYCLDVLRELLAVFKDPQLISASYYFEEVGRLFDLMMICIDRDDYLIVLLKLLKNGIDNDKDRLAQVTESHKAFMHELIGLKSKARNRELMALVYAVSAFVDIRESLMDARLNAIRSRQLSPDDRAVLEAGQPVIAYIHGKLNKNALLKFNFVKDKFTLLNVERTASPQPNDKRRLSFMCNRIGLFGQGYPDDNARLEAQFRTYFTRSLRADLYFSFLILDANPGGVEHVSVALVFENEFKCARWKALMAMLANK